MTLAEKLIEEGRQEGRYEGRQGERQSAILEALEFRLGPVPSGLTEAVLSNRDLTQLEKLFHLALTSPDFESFAAGL